MITGLTPLESSVVEFVSYFSISSFVFVGIFEISIDPIDSLSWVSLAMARAGIVTACWQFTNRCPMPRY